MSNISPAASTNSKKVDTCPTSINHGWLGGSPQNNVHLPTKWYPWIQAGSYYSLLALRVDRMINICDLHSLKKTASRRNHGLSKDCLFGSLDVANLARKAGMIVSWWSRLSGALRRKLQVLKNKTQMSWAQLASKCKRHRKTCPDLPRIYTLYIYNYIYINICAIDISISSDLLCYSGNWESQICRWISDDPMKNMFDKGCLLLPCLFAGR